MTAQAIEGSRERCFEHGMDDFIGKPVKLADLARTLETWLPKSTSDRAALSDVSSKARIYESVIAYAF